MKILHVLWFSLLLFSCTSTQKVIEESSSEEEEWEVTVFDVGYENFLLSRARPMSFYSETSLHLKNSMLVPQWNARVNQGSYNRNVYENIIDYDVNEKYGLVFEYRLYQAFVYVAWKYGEKFNGLASEINANL